MRRRATMRRAAGLLALLAAGWFIHDAVLHAGLSIFGMSALIATEFGLPDLSARGIFPDRAIQTLALLFAAAAAGVFLWLGLRTWRR